MDSYVDKDGTEWRPHPDVPSEWQILIKETGAWCDAAYGPDEILPCSCSPLGRDEYCHLHGGV